MSKLLPITSILLLTVAFALAKSSSTTSSQVSPAAQANAKERTVRGCLSGTNSNYTLTDSSGRVWQLEGSADQLKSEIGHTVAITGRGTNAAVMAGNSRDYIDVDMASINDLKVSSVKQISATCSQQNERYARSQAAAVLAAG